MEIHEGPFPYQVRSADKMIAGWTKSVFVEAPAGYGKTALLRSMHNQVIGRGGDTVWFDSYSADETEKLKTIVTAHVANKTSLLVLIDNAHTIAAAIFEPLGMLLDQHEHVVQFAIAGRTRIPLRVPRRTVQNEALMIKASDLQLDDIAAGELVNAAGLTDPSVKIAIVKMADGWPAGIRMAIIEARKGASNRGQLIDALSLRGGLVERYLLDEITQSAPDSSVELLYIAATLGRFTTKLVEYVGKINDAEERIAECEDRGLFFQRTLEGWIEINSLVGACLEAQLRRTHPETSQNYHLAAAEWHEQNNHISDAIAHAFGGGDVDRAASLLAQSSRTHERIGRWRSFSDWIARLPDGMLDRYPAISLEAAPAHAVLYEYDAADAQIERLQKRSGSLTRSQAVSLIAAQAIVAAFADRPLDALRFGELGQADMGSADAYNRGVFLTASAIGRIECGNIAEANRLTLEAQAIHDASHNTFGATFALALNGLTLAIGGHLDSAMARWVEGSRLIEPSEQAPALEAIASGYLPMVFYEWNDLDGAQTWIERSLASSVEVALPDAVASIYITACRLAAIRNDHYSVERWLSDAAALAVRRRWPRLYQAATWERITLALRDNKVRQASKLKLAMDQSGTFADMKRTGGLNLEGNCAEIRFDLIVRGRRSDFAALRGAINRAKNDGRLWQASRLLVIEAVARNHRGEIATALRAMRKALQLAQTGRLLRTFLDEGPAAVTLIQSIATEESKLAKSMLDLDYLNDILSNAGEQRVVLGIAHADVEALSAREVEVMTLVATGLSNKALASRLFVSENTVKWHLQHVFAKLHVANRTSAIEVARAHGQID